MKDDSLDHENYTKERVDFLIKFIAHRDGYDVRPGIRSGKYTIVELEEFYEGGIDSAEMDDEPMAEPGEDEGKFGHVSRPQPYLNTHLDPSPGSSATSNAASNTDINPSAKAKGKGKASTNSSSDTNAKAKTGGAKSKTSAIDSATKPQVQTAYNGVSFSLSTHNIN
jgi:hypothetical protein